MIWCEKTVDLHLKRVSANAAVSLVSVNFAFRQFAGRKLPGLFRCGSSSEKIFAFVKSFFGVLLRKTYLICFVKESVPVSAERSDAACIKTGTRNIVILLFSSQIFKKQSALQCRVERQISVKFIRLVE